MLNIPEEVKIALRQGNRRKNYKMLVNDVDPETGERTYLYIIDNNSIVRESVKIDERMVTGKNLKFGLCEGSSLEFQYFDHPNINGKDIQVFVSIEYVDSNGDVAWYDIPMGWYTVDQCPVQWDTGIYKVTAYNKLKSKYLDQKANNIVLGELINKNIGMSMYSLRRLLLQDFEIVPYEEYEIQGSTGGQRSTTPKKEIKFTNLYTGDTPINGENIRRTFNTNPTTNNKIYIQIITEYKRFSLANRLKQFQYREFGYSLGRFSEDLAAYIKTLIDNSSLNATGQQVLDAIDTVWDDGYGYYSEGWSHLCSVELALPQVGYSDYFYYSDYAYKNGRTSQGYPITGATTDLTKVLLTLYSTCFIHIPRYIWIDYWFDSNTRGTIRIDLETGCDYYAPDGTRKHYDGLKMPDGSDYNFEEFAASLEYVRIDDLTPGDLVTVDPSTLPEYTLREITSAVYETNCQYGQLDRVTDLFAPVELNQGGLYPADTLYPDNALYPQGNMLHPLPSSYSKLWTDTVGEQSFRYLIITYKTIDDGQEVEKTLQRTVNTYGTTNYNMSDNWLFLNLVWTAEDVGTYADAMVEKMRDIRWFPFEMWAAGLPHIETGDAIEITDKNGDTHTSYVLTRTLNGIQDLQDTFINGELDVF